MEKVKGIEKEETWAIPGLSRINVRLDGVGYSLNIHDYIDIKESLVAECTRLGSDLAFLKALKADIQKQISHSKLEFEKFQAKKWETIKAEIENTSGGKATIKAVDTAIEADSEIYNWKALMIEKNYILQTIQGWIDSLHTKEKMLTELTQYERYGLYLERSRDNEH